MADGLGKCFNCERLQLHTFSYGKRVKLFKVFSCNEIRYYCSKCKEIYDEISQLDSEESHKKYLKDLIDFGTDKVAEYNRSKFEIVN